MKTVFWIWACSACLIVGIITGPKVHYGFLDNTTFGNILQFFGTLSIPFLYYFILEQRRTSKLTFRTFIERELNAVLARIQEAYDLQSEHFLVASPEDALVVYRRSFHLVSDGALRLLNLAILVEAQNQPEDGKAIRGILRFTRDLKEHILTRQEEAERTGEISLDNQDQIQNSYAHVIYNHYVTLLRLHGYHIPKSQQAARESQPT